MKLKRQTLVRAVKTANAKGFLSDVAHDWLLEYALTASHVGLNFSTGCPITAAGIADKATLDRDPRPYLAWAASYDAVIWSETGFYQALTAETEMGLLPATVEVED